MASNINFGTNLAAEFSPVSILERGAWFPKGQALAALVQSGLNQIGPSASSSEDRPSIMGRRVFSLKSCLGLSPTEDLLLQIMFKRWHLSPNIVLLNLFGTDLHSKISSLSDYLPKPAVDFLIHEFFTYFFCTYNIYDRDNKIFPEKQPGITEKYFCSIPTIQKKLLLLKTEISKSISLKNMITEANSLSAKKPKRSSPKIAAKIEERYETAKRLEKGISDTIDLIVKILAHENSAHVLLKMTINAFEGTENRIPPSLENSHLALDHLSAYANYCASMMQSAAKAGILNLHTESFWQGVSNLSLQASPLPSQEKISEIRGYLHKMTHIIGDHMRLRELEMSAAQKGELTHASWLIKNGMHSRNYKAQNEFIEGLILNRVAASTHDFLTSQFWSIFETQVIAPAYPNFSPLHHSMQRLIGCISWYPTIAKHEPIHSPNTLPERFQNYFSELITEIEDEYKESVVLGNKKIVMEKLSLASDGFNLSFWINELKLLDYHATCAQLSEMKQKLAAIPAKLTQFLEEEKKTLPPDISAAELKQIANEVQKICFNKSLSLACIVIAMEDADTIVHGRFITGPKHIPQELADIIILDWVEELLESPTPPVESEEDLSEPSAAAELEEPLAPSSPEPELPIPKAVEEESAAPEPIARAVQVRPPRAREVLQAVPRKRSHSPVPQALRSLTKVEKVIAMLKAHGFTEKRQGPHLILADDVGHVVPIPRGSKGQKKGLKPGTLASIFRQATAPLEHKE